MSFGGIAVILALLVVPMGNSGEDDPTFLGEALADSKFASEGNLQYESQEVVEAATGAAPSDVVPSGDVPSLAVAVYARSGGSGSGGDASGASGERDFGPDGLCVVSDWVDPVAGLVPCDDIVNPPDEEDADEEDEGEPAADEPEPVIITVSRSDFAELPLAHPGVHLQPEREWFLVNLDTFVYADGGQQILETTVLDVPVAVRATPVEYSWDFGDGSDPLVTAEAGQAWPAEGIGHVYTAEAEGVVVSLTTTWSGEFQVAGQGPWIPIAGTTTTQSQSAPFRIDAVETRLTANG